MLPFYLQSIFNHFNEPGELPTAPLRDKHVTFNWSYAEPVLGPCIGLPW